VQILGTWPSLSSVSAMGIFAVVRFVSFCALNLFRRGAPTRPASPRPATAPSSATTTTSSSATCDSAPPCRYFPRRHRPIAQGPSRHVRAPSARASPARRMSPTTSRRPHQRGAGILLLRRFTSRPHAGLPNRHGMFHGLEQIPPQQFCPGPQLLTRSFSGVHLLARPAFPPRGGHQTPTSGVTNRDLVATPDRGFRCRPSEALAQESRRRAISGISATSGNLPDSATDH